MGLALTGSTGCEVNVDIFVDSRSEVGLAKQIYEQIRRGVLDGRLASGDRIPPSRELAATLQVSRHTVTTADEQLAAEGYVDGRRGGGTVVSDLYLPALPRDATSALAPPPSPHRAASAIRFDPRPGHARPSAVPHSRLETRHAVRDRPAPRPRRAPGRTGRPAAAPGQLDRARVTLTFNEPVAPGDAVSSAPSAGTDDSSTA